MTTDASLPCGLPPQNGFLPWYIYASGLSKVPLEFHLWSAISAVSACLADRVWCEKFADEKLFPNLYVMLIGPSGTGKNQAWRRAQRLVERVPEKLRHDYINLYRGKATAEGLLLYFSKGKNSRIWLITPELAMEVGGGLQAESFITHMTELMDADQAGFQGMTVTRGHIRLPNPPVINWGSGTTPDWLLRSIGRQDILGGFFARICAVVGERNPVRYAKVLYPPDYTAVNAWLTDCLTYMLSMSGRMEIDPHADELHTWWYDNRPEPDNPLLWPFWEHGDNLVYKLSMNLAACDHYRMTIEYVHMDGAIALYEWLYSKLGAVLEFAYRNPEVEKLELILGTICAAPFVAYKTLLRLATSRGFTKDDLEKTLRTLCERGDVQPFNVGTSGRHERAYRRLV